MRWSSMGQDQSTPQGANRFDVTKFIKEGKARRIIVLVGHKTSGIAASRMTSVLIYTMQTGAGKLTPFSCMAV
jgi:hypothetical protein